MANVKISELPAASSAAGTDELPANQAGTTRKLTRAQIVDGLATAGAVTSSGLSMATARLLGRTTASTGAVEEISAGTGLTLTSGSVAADVATAANIHAGTANKLVAAAEIYSANAPVTSSGTGDHAFDFAAGRVFQRTLTGNSTLTNPTNQTAGQSGIIYIIQDATGGRTLSYGADYKPIGGAPTIDTGANKVNVFSYYVRSANNVSLSYLGAE